MQKSAMWLMGLSLGLGACSSSSSEPAGSGGTKNPGSSGGGLADVGDPCTGKADCATNYCLTTKDLSETLGKPVDVPDGYCSKLLCSADSECSGSTGKCYDIEAYFGQPAKACFAACETAADCRDGYRCSNGSGGPSAALPGKVCLPPGLLCFLKIPDASCPDVGAGGAGGAGGTAAAGGAGGK